MLMLSNVISTNRQYMKGMLIVKVNIAFGFCTCCLFNKPHNLFQSCNDSYLYTMYRTNMTKTLLL